MRQVEYLRAWNDGTWDTLVVDVPSMEEDECNGVDFSNSDDSDLLDYADCVLTKQDIHKGIALFAVLNSEV